MKRITIAAPEDLLERLRIIARQENISLAEVIRQGMELRASQRRRRPRFIAAGASSEPPYDMGRRSADVEYTPDSWR